MASNKYRGGILGEKVVSIHDWTCQQWVQESDRETPPAQIGRLLIPLMSGIGFYTATQRGITSRRGEFAYLPGERITFHIGTAELPAADAGPAVTPYDMGTTEHEPINVVRLLYSVCKKRNGTCAIPAELMQSLKGPIDFAVEPDAFALQPGVVALVEQLDCHLLDEKTAVDRLDTSIACYVLSAYLDVALTLWFSASPSSHYSLSLNSKGDEP